MSTRVQTLTVSSEQALEQLVINDLESIESGLIFLENQVAADEGSIDILAVDSRDKTLVVIELKKEKSDRMLVQTLQYYDFVRKNVERFARMYADKYAIDALSEPRIILVAHSFSETLRAAVKYINVSITLTRYEYLQIGNQRGLYFTEVSIPPTFEFARRRKSVQEHLEYIVNDSVRKVCRDFINRVESFDQQSVTIKGLRSRISVKYNGINWIDIHPRQENFHVRWYGNWDNRVTLEKEADLTDELLGEIIRAVPGLTGSDEEYEPEELDE